MAPPGPFPGGSLSGLDAPNQPPLPTFGRRRARQTSVPNALNRISASTLAPLCARRVTTITPLARSYVVYYG